MAAQRWVLAVLIGGVTALPAVAQSGTPRGAIDLVPTAVPTALAGGAGWHAPPMRHGHFF